MAHYTPPKDIVRYVQDLEDRITRLEKLARLAGASIDNDSLTINDDSGRRRALLGLQDNGTFGITVWDSAGNVVGGYNA
jgi:hypothetical protein